MTCIFNKTQQSCNTIMRIICEYNMVRATCNLKHFTFVRIK